ncbi:MAG: hypothetical protein WCX48_09765 [Bacteroidales bacterium]
MKTRKWQYGSTIINFTCEDFEEGIWLDTVVYINGYEVCVIAGVDIDNFINDYKRLITKYRI